MPTPNRHPGLIAEARRYRGFWYGRLRDDLIGAERGYCPHKHKTETQALACAKRHLKTRKGAWFS